MVCYKAANLSPTDAVKMLLEVSMGFIRPMHAVCLHITLR